MLIKIFFNILLYMDAPINSKIISIWASVLVVYFPYKSYSLLLLMQLGHSVVALNTLTKLFSDAAGRTPAGRTDGHYDKNIPHWAFMKAEHICFLTRRTRLWSLAILLQKIGPASKLTNIEIYKYST